MQDDSTVKPAPAPPAPAPPAPVPDAPIAPAPVPPVGVRSNNAEQGAGQKELPRFNLMAGESLAAFALRMGRPVSLIRAANLESIAPDQSILDGVTGLVVPDNS